MPVHDRMTVAPSEGRSARIPVRVLTDPLYLLLITMLSLFLGMVIVIVILSLLPPVLVSQLVFLDVLLLIVIVFPTLYFFSFKPLRSYNSELKRMQELLAESETKYRSLVESTQDAIYLLDRECRYLFINQMHQTRMGFSDDRYVGRSYSEFHSPEETEDLLRKVGEVFRTGRSVQHEHKSKRDEEYFLRTLSPVKGPDGSIVAVTVVSKNIHDLKHMEERFSHT